jgi:predicted transposase/invertase (TIGR01784 family)
MKLFSLTVDFAFKSLFAPNPDLLISLINSFPSFQAKNRVVNLKVLNPEIPKEISSEKLSLLDIKAENELGEKFLIEMQAFAHSSFTKRALYYWAKTYSRSLNKGQDYEELKKVYSINFVKYSIWKNDSEYLSVFHVLEKTRKFPLRI